MAIMRTLKFAFECSCDGVSTSLDFPIATLPMWLISPGVVGELSKLLDTSVTKPAEVIHVYTNTGNCPDISVASITDSGDTMHIEFSSAPPDDLTVTILGTLVF